MKKHIDIFFGLIFTIMLLFSHLTCMAKDLTITPSLEVGGVYDDNLDFTSSDEEDDFGGQAIPKLTLDYSTELLQFSLIGQLDIIKYYNQTDFDRTNQLYGFNGRYQAFSRWAITGNFRYRRDETVDSQLEETGQATERDRVKTYDSGGGVFYQLTELSDIGLEVDYRKRNYSSDEETDYDRYTFSTAYTKRFANQRDTLGLVPEYSFLYSDEEDATDYRFTVEWERRTSETFTTQLNVGARYTEIEDVNGKDDQNWGYLGLLGMRKWGETYSTRIELMRDIRVNTDAEIVEVNRLLIIADKRFLERMGLRFRGAAYLTETESSNAEDEKTTFFELQPTLYYMLTENHSIELAYTYQNEKEHDKPGNPVTQRNSVFLGFRLKFPKKWE